MYLLIVSIVRCLVGVRIYDGAAPPWMSLTKNSLTIIVLGAPARVYAHYSLLSFSYIYRYDLLFNYLSLYCYCG